MTLSKVLGDTMRLCTCVRCPSSPSMLLYVDGQCEALTSLLHPSLATQVFSQ